MVIQASQWRFASLGFVCLGCALFSEIHAVKAADAPAVTISNLWTLKLGGHSDCVPAIGSNGVVYIGNFDGKLWAINPEGTRRWVFETREVGRSNIEIKSSPVVGTDGTVYFGCRDNRFYAVAPDGTLKWSFLTAGWVDSTAAIGADGAIYFGSWDSLLYCLTAGGQKKWEYKAGAEILSSPVITRAGEVCLGANDGVFHAVRSDGAKAWAFKAGAPIISSAAIDSDGAIYFTSVNGMFYALNPDGTSRWKLKTGGFTASSPVITQAGNILVGVNKDIWAISREGKKLWQHPATYDNYQQPIHANPVALVDNSIIAVSGYGLLANYSDQPKMVWKHYLYGHGAGGPAVGPDGTVYAMMGIPNVGRGLGAFSNTVAIAKSPWPRFRGPLANGRAE